jgi:hypothetical protein
VRILLAPWTARWVIPPGGGEITFDDAGYESSEVESFPEHTERVNIRYTPGKRTGPITCDFEIRQSYIGYAAPPSVTFHVLPRATVTRIPDGIPTRHRSANGISRAVGCTRRCGRSRDFSNHLTAVFLLPSRCRGSSDPATVHRSASRRRRRIPPVHRHVAHRSPSRRLSRIDSAMFNSHSSANVTAVMKYRTAI